MVVEGRGDAIAVPILLRSILADQGMFDPCGKPVACLGRTKATRAGGIEKFVGVVAARPGSVGILIVLDGNDDPVCELGPALAERAGQASRGKPVFVVLAEPTFEEWIVASADTQDIELEFDRNHHPVALIKAALGETKYTKPIWQPRLASRICITLAEARSLSFARLANRTRMLGEMLQNA